MNPKRTLMEIHSLIISLVGTSLSSDQNFPRENGNPSKSFKIDFNNADVLSVAIKSIPYTAIYSSMVNARSFNLKLIDGALMGFRYRFANGSIIEHCLTYFPAPNLEAYQTDPNIYGADDIYGDIVGRNVVHFPIRFDFNSCQKRYKEILHPYSHLSLGQYKNCRIPVCSPMGPLTFARFILRNFYDTDDHVHSNAVPEGGILFGKTISSNEQLIPHLVLCR